ncbi:MAG: hypothetical protein AAGH15_09740 [Myxococcota bacterium]
MEWSFRAEVPDGPVVEETLLGNPWEVEILEAWLILGPAYGFSPTRTNRPGLASFFGPSRAFAHAGDDNSSGVRVVCELLDQVAVDLLDPAPRSMQVALGEADAFENLAEAGPVESMNIVLDRARRELAATDGPTGGGTALLRAVARRTLEGEDQEVRFRAVLTTETITTDPIARRVEGLPVSGELVDGAVVEIVADPRAWVRQMTFDALLDAPTNAAGEVEVAEPSQLHNAWYLGLQDPTGWNVSIRAAEPTQAP